MVGDDRALGAASDLERVVDVIEVAVRDEHQVASVDRLQRLGSGGLALYHRVPRGALSLGAPDLPRPVSPPTRTPLNGWRDSYIPPLVLTAKTQYLTRAKRKY